MVLALRGTEADVRLLNPAQLARYRAGSPLGRVVGGHFKHSPVSLQVPYDGHWHVTVDLGGAAGHVESAILDVIAVAA